MKKGKALKAYSIIISVAFIFSTVGFFVLFFLGGYDTKILVKLGLKEPVVKTPWAVDGWNNTMEKLDYDADIVFLGDSITYAGDFRLYFPDQKIVNLGYIGDSLVGMEQRVSAVSAVNPEKVFILGGINGLSDLNVQNCLSAYSRLLCELREELPNAEIYVQSVLPISFSKELSVCRNSTIKKFNHSLQKLANENGMTYIDLYSLYEFDGEMNPNLSEDGVHILPEAYEIWAEAISEYID